MRALTQSPSDKGLSSMRTYRDAKLMAKNLRQVLGARQLEISHSESLEIVAKQFGCDNWNILSARISAPENPLNSSPQFEPAIPILGIFSVEKAIEFYCDFLGFSINWKQDEREPVYMQVSRGGLVLHLSEHHGDASPGSTAFVPITNVDTYHAELSTKKYQYMNLGIKRLPWGRVLAVTDPFSNRLRFCERS